MGLAAVFLLNAGCGDADSRRATESRDTTTPAGEKAEVATTPGAGSEREGGAAAEKLPPLPAPVPLQAGPGVPERFVGLTMVEALAKIDETTDPGITNFLNEKRVKICAANVETTTGDEQLKWRAKLGEELLFAGQTQEGIEQIQRTLGALGDRGTPITVHNRHLWQMLAIGYLRLGEQQNCIHHHTHQSCLFPIQGEGVHDLEEGSRQAIPVYEDVLTQFPGNYEARWLLNLAYMTLGEYPEKVPKEWLISGLDRLEPAGFPRFAERAGATGLGVLGSAGGCCIEDFDNDGDLDVLVTGMHLDEQCHLFRNDSDGTFTDVTETSGLVGMIGGLNTLHADYDNDGLVDIFILRGGWFYPEGNHPNTLLRNLGGLRFADVTQAAGVLSFHRTQAGVWADFDQDGWLDLFVGNESEGTDHQAGEFYHNQGDGTFKERAREVGLGAFDFVKGVTAADYNNDGYPDLYVSHCGGDNRLFRNDGPVSGASGEGGARRRWTFTNVARVAQVSEPYQSFATWFWDFDNDGNEDLFACSFDMDRSARQSHDYARELSGQPIECEVPRLYRNLGDGRFQDVTEAMGLQKVMYGMGANYGDLNNDGWLDFYVGTGAPDYRAIVPNRMFLNRAGTGAVAGLPPISGRGPFFQEVTAAGGFGHLQKGHGIAFADFDLDGDQDVYAVMGGLFRGDVYQNVLFENPANTAAAHPGRKESGPRNAWITLVLEGDSANRKAVGARIKLVVSRGSASGTGSSREIHRTVSTGGSFGADPLWAEIGLGDAESIQSLEITWPVRGWPKSTFKDVPMNTRLKIREGAQEWEEWPMRPIVLGGEKAAY